MKKGSTQNKKKGKEENPSKKIRDGMSQDYIDDTAGNLSRYHYTLI